MSNLQDRAKSMLAFAKARLRKASAWQRNYETPEGREVIHDILRETGILSVAHVEGDPGTSAFNEGRRSIGLVICERLRWSEGEIVALSRQQTSEQLEQEG